MGTQPRRLLPALVLACVTFASPCGADEYETLYLDRLRSRQLFGLAEKYCEDALAGELPVERRGRLAAELARTLIEHGKHLPGGEREVLWKQSEQLLMQQAAKINDGPIRLQLTVAGAVNSAYQATFLRWHAQVTPQDPTLRAAALTRGQQATRALKSAITTVDRDKSTPASKRSTLREQLTYHVANTLMDRARLAEPDSADRLGLVTSVEEDIRTIAARASDTRIRLEAKVLQAECARERGDGPRAISLLDSALKLAVEDGDRDRIFAERVRVLLYDQKPDEAAEQLIQWRKARGSLSGELHVVRMRALIALWRVARTANNDALAASFLKQMESGAQYAANEVGGYWAVRCERLLRDARSVSTLGPKLAALKQQAETEFASGKLTEAAASFQQAATQAGSEGRDVLAAGFLYQRGSILIQTKDLVAAAEAFRRSANTIWTDQPNAHLMWSWCLGRLYSAKATRANRLAYTTALTDHRAQFQGGPTFAEATFMLASLEETRLQNTKAIDLYRQIRVQHQPRYQQASASIARCYGKILSRLEQLGKPELFAEWHGKAVNDLLPRLDDIPDDPWTPVPDHAELMIRTASVLLRGRKPDYRQCTALLNRGLPAIEELPSGPRVNQLLDEARRWKLLLSLIAGDTKQAATLTTRLQSASASESFALLETIAQLTVTDRAAAEALAQIQLQIGSQTLKGVADLTPAQALRLRVWMVRFHVANGESDQALGLARQLLSSVKDATALATIAGTVQTVGTRDANELGRRIWKQVEALTKAGSKPWLRARLHVTWCTYHLNEIEECRKLLRVTRLLYPDLGDESMAAAFKRLEDQVLLKR